MAPLLHRAAINSNSYCRGPHNTVNFSPLTAEIRWRFGAPQQISTCSRLGFVTASTSFTGGQPNSTMFSRLLGWYTIYTFSGAFTSWWNFATCNIHFASKSCVLLYWQHYCMALDQWASAKLCSVIQGMELRNFRRGRHLYSAGRPSRWASAHIRVCHNWQLHNFRTTNSWTPVFIIAPWN